LGLFNTYQFANPEILWGLLSIPFIVFWYIITQKNKAATLATSSYKQISDISSGFYPSYIIYFLAQKQLQLVFLLSPWLDHK